jgi:hypothetical protein
VFSGESVYNFKRGIGMKDLSDQLKATISGLVLVLLIELLPFLEPARDALTEVVLLVVGYIVSKGLEKLKVETVEVGETEPAILE